MFMGLTGAALWVLPAQALPQNGQVSAGSAAIQPVGTHQLDILQSSDRAVINWNSFSIAQPERVNFQQPSVNAVTLNRVTGNLTSEIAGQLTANGQIMLINPNGILFTPTAQVNVGSLLATTLDIADSDFMVNQLKFHQIPNQPLATVENQGTISVAEGGFAALVAPGLSNNGVINALGGTIALASGTAVTLDFYGDGLLSIAVDEAVAQQLLETNGQSLLSLIDNAGTLNADGGMVRLTARTAANLVNSVINMDGVIQARAIDNENGTIVLDGGNQGTVSVAGVLDAAGVESGQTGGTVQVLGHQIAMVGDALIDVSGDVGGGIALVGGNFQGQGPLPPALVTTAGEDVVINADALTLGNGGTVVAWAEDTTRFLGTITARGGQAGGDGGLVETSGKLLLDVNGVTVDTSAPQGATGTWLLDPHHLVIGEGSDSNISAMDGLVEPTDGAMASFLSAETLETALMTSNVSILTSDASDDSGDIELNAPSNIDANGFALDLTGRRFIHTAGVFNLTGGETADLTFNLNQVNPETIAPSTSINDALNATGTIAGTTTINLGAGTYQGETIRLSDNVTLKGESQESSILKGASRVLHNPEGITAIVEDVTITGGTALNGGGIQNNGTLTLSNSTVTGNAAELFGGGILNTGTLNVEASTINNNVAILGGGIANVGANIDEISNILDDSDGIEGIEDIAAINELIGNLGTIQENIVSSTLTVSGSTVSNNVNSAIGGGILNLGGTTTLEDGTTLAGNAAILGGGIANVGVQININGLSIGGTSIAPISLEVDSTLMVSGSEVNQNNATLFGGGIANLGGDVTVTADSTLAGNSAILGGSIANLGFILDINDVSVAEQGESETITSNTIRLSFPSTLTVADSTLNGNMASLFGGAIANLGGDATVTSGSIITGNSSSHGGGIANLGATVRLTPMTLSGLFPGEASSIELIDGLELALDSDAINLAIDGFEISIGSIDLDLPSTLTVSGSEVSQNTAEAFGGGIANLGADLTVQSSTLAGNTAGFGGGAANLDDLDLEALGLNTIDGIDILAGLMETGITETGSSTINIHSSTFSDNSAMNGGGVFNNLGLLNVVNSTLSGNSAQTSGGAIDNLLGSVFISNSTLTGNMASDGGAIANRGSENEVTNVTFQYIFASEEYNEFVDSPFNDAFAFFLNGENIALLPGTNTPVTVNTINNGDNAELFNDNGTTLGDPTPFPTEYDGFTVVLTAEGTIQPDGTNTFKLVIADNSDTSLDSAVFLAENSFGSFALGGSSGESAIAFATTDLNTVTAEDLIAALVGPGVTTSNVEFFGDEQALGLFSGGTTLGLGIDRGIILSSGNIADAQGPNISEGTTTNFGTPGDADLNTITTPSSTADAAGLQFEFIANPVRVLVQNSIVAGNSAATNNEISDQPGTVVSNGFNLVGQDGNVGGFPTIDTDLVLLGPIGTAIDTDLSNNGGLTRTHALVSGSPAINAGNNNLAVDENDNSLITDQRGEGFDRIVNNTVDIGSFESPPSPLSPPSPPILTPPNSDAEAVTNQVTLPDSTNTVQQDVDPPEESGPSDPRQIVAYGNYFGNKAFEFNLETDIEESQRALASTAANTQRNPGSIFMMKVSGQATVANSDDGQPSDPFGTLKASTLVASNQPLLPLQDTVMAQNIESETPQCIPAESVKAGDPLWQFDSCGWEILFPADESIEETDQLLIVLVTPNGKVTRRIVEEATYKQIIATVRQFQKQVTNARSRESSYLPLAQQLYQWLIAPLDPILEAEEIDNLVFVLDEGLRSMPFAALHDGTGFIVERYSVGLMPSMTLSDTSPRNLQEMNILAMGADEFEEEDPLPAVPVELSTISNQLWAGQSESLLNEAFTPDNLKQLRASKEFGIVHLATHGDFKAGKPNKSYVQFWDQKITLDQMKSLELTQNQPVSLLVLSACRTALGDRQAELGFTGLAVATGVQTAVGGLWYISDIATLALMTNFYAQLKVAPIRADALQQAQLAMINDQVQIEGDRMMLSGLTVPLPEDLQGFDGFDFSHPYFWSGITMIGNPW